MNELNILVLGNGFDLSHLLPTKYENFLHTVSFLQKNYNSSFTTVGKVFGDNRLQKSDNFIYKCYEKHNKNYDIIELDPNKINRLLEMANNNFWFSYFLKSFNNDLGWIDIEREISNVIEAFRDLFSDDSIEFLLKHSKRSNSNTFILEHFNFFYRTSIYKRSDGTPSEYSNKKIALDHYALETPYRSKNFVLNKERIVGTLYDNLQEFSEILKIYLDCFVNSTLNTISSSTKPIIPPTRTDIVFTFNYTNTYEKLYKADVVRHFHGSIFGDIILGINADKYDELESFNTDFIRFKKYYQRLIHNTDFDFNNDICHASVFNTIKDSIQLSVIGHSLDVTDKDILVELFDISQKLIIYYHNEEAKRSYIKNLLSFYGKTRFYDLKKNKNLEFINLNKAGDPK